MATDGAAAGGAAGAATRRSLLRAAVVTGTLAASALGWVRGGAPARGRGASEVAGARSATNGAGTSPGTSPGTSAGGAGSVSGAASAASAPGVRDRDAWQPSPMAVAGKPLADPAWREVTFHSDVLRRDMPYLVWLPPSYDRLPGRLPVLYLLHGAGDGSAPGRFEWQGMGLGDALSALLKKGGLPYLVVLPEGEQGYWMNHSPDSDKTRWADYMAQDVVAHVDRTFRTDPRPARRAVGGLSMGGHGAVQLALNFPAVFRIAGAHSPSIRDYEQSPPFFGDQAWYARWDPRILARTGRATRDLTAWVDWGSADRWKKGAQELADALDAGGAHLERRQFPGMHDGTYWRAHVPDYLDFYAHTFA